MRKTNLEHIISEAVKSVINEANHPFDRKHPANKVELGYDKNLRYGDDFAKNGGNFMVIRNGKPYYVSRNTTVSLYVFAKNKNGEWCTLVNQRGHGSTKGLFNVTCGYLDMGAEGKPQETLQQAACREAFEENGVKIDSNSLVMLGVNSQHRNINAAFYCVINDRTIEQMPTTTSHAEAGEVLTSLWIPLSQVNNYKFISNQNAKIEGIAKKALGDYDKKNGGNRLNSLIAMLRNRIGSDQESQYLLSEILKEAGK